MKSTHRESILDAAEQSRRLFDLCARFQQDLAHNHHCRVEAVLDETEFESLPDAARKRWLADLVRVEIECRRNRGEDVSVDEYAERFSSDADWLIPRLQEILSSLSAYQSTMNAKELVPDGRDVSMTFPFLEPHVSEPAPEMPCVGRYELQEELGRGGFGEVWKARDPLLNRLVAIKLMRFRGAGDDFAKSQFLAEGSRLAELDHPGIVRVLDAGWYEGRPYLVSSFMAGKTLEHRLSQGPIDRRDAIRWTIDLALALHHAHLRGYVHRDIKPSNILFDAHGNPLLADFGMSASEMELVAEPPSRSGTACYMSPEQARGQSHLADPRSDVYSLGVVLYRLLTGRLPFVSSNPQDYLQQVLTREPRPLRAIDSTIPVPLEEFCLTCLRKEIADRPNTALEVAEHLRGLLGENSGTNNWRWWVAAGLILLLGGGSALAISTLRFGSKVDPESITAPDWQDPEVIAWSPYSHHDEYGYNPKQGVFAFDAFGEALFRAGVQTRDDVTLRLNFQFQQANGLAGVFWGLRRDQFGEPRCWGIKLGRHDHNSPVEMQILEWKLGPYAGGRQIVFGGRLLKRVTIEPIIGQSTLVVDATIREVRQVTLNGTPLLDEEFPLTEGDWSIGPGSGVGFCGQSGRVLVFDFSSQ